MKENKISNIALSKFSKDFTRNKLFTEQKQNSAFKIVVPNVEIIICSETLAPSKLEQELILLERNYKSEFRARLNLNTAYTYVI